MLKDIQAAVRTRAIIVFLLVHAGLALALTGSSASPLLLTGIAGLYGGFLLGAFFILRPLLEWIKQSRRAEYWFEEFNRHLPTILENLPKVIATIREVRAAWHEGERTVHHERIRRAE